jgi:phage terminase large subunit
VAEYRISLKARPYQQEVIDWFRPKDHKSGRGKAGKRAVEVWHRRAGKDRTATFIESELAFSRVGLYWHALPEYAQARRVIWDAITRDGQRLIDISFPPEICKRQEHEMKITLPNGSIWQPVGADNFNSLVGSNPVHVTYSEYALMAPAAREYLRPIIAENDGSELFISTPRGYNHFHDLYEHAKGNPLWHTSRLSVYDTGVIPEVVLDEERKTMPEELFRQEFECDFSAANVGAILGRWVEQAEKEGRISDDIDYDSDGAGLVVSSDIGFRDTATWWFWQPRPDGFALVDYDQDSGLDAEEWIPRIKERIGRRKVDRIWLPQDAKAKTFTSSHSAIEQFLEAFGPQIMDIVPKASKLDRINAARHVMGQCHFHKTRCHKGLMGLRAWAFEWNQDTRQFSRDPKHDWASHPGDGFSYGAQVLQKYVKKIKLGTEPIEGVRELPGGGWCLGKSLEDMYKERPKQAARI